MSKRMDLIRLNGLSDRWCGPFTWSDVRDAGIPRGTIRRLLDDGQLVRLGRSSYVDATIWNNADSWEQHRLSAIGFALSAAPGAHLTGWSAGLVLGYPTWGRPPAQVTAIRDHATSSGTTQSGFADIRTGYFPAAHRWNIGRVRLSGMAFTAVDIARHGTSEQALIAVDHALRHGASLSVLRSVVDDLATYPGIELAEWAVDHGDERSEGPLETLGRLAFIEAGRPAPLSNVWISSPAGDFRVDHLLEKEGVVLEGDGASKLRDSDDPHEAMRKQTIRESAIRAKGFAVERYDFAMAAHHRHRIVSLADAAARGHVAPPRSSWSLEPPDRLRRWYRAVQSDERRAVNE